MPTEKHALVTVGATAPFPRLIQQLLTPSVLTTLTSLNYTHLTIQHGLTPTNYGGTSDGESLLATLNTFTPPFTSPTSSSTSLNIASFPFSDSLQDEMAKSDLVISHAGSGSILDALRMTKKLIVVPNEELMDNHQKELARELERQGYLVDSTPESLSNAIKKAEYTVFKHFPRSGSETFSRVVDEEMGYVELD